MRPENADPPAWFGAFRRGRVHHGSPVSAPNLTVHNPYKYARDLNARRDTSFLKVQPARLNFPVDGGNMENLLTKVRFASTAPPVVQASHQTSVAPTLLPPPHHTVPPRAFVGGGPPGPAPAPSAPLSITAFGGEMSPMRARDDSPVPTSMSYLIEEARLLREANEQLLDRNAELEAHLAGASKVSAERDALRVENDALHAALEGVRGHAEAGVAESKAALEAELDAVRRECERQRAQISEKMQEEAERVEAQRARAEGAIASNRNAMGDADGGAGGYQKGEMLARMVLGVLARSKAATGAASAAAAAAGAPEV